MWITEDPRRGGGLVWLVGRLPWRDKPQPFVDFTERKLCQLPHLAVNILWHAWSWWIGDKELLQNTHEDLLLRGWFKEQNGLIRLSQQKHGCNKQEEDYEPPYCREKQYERFPLLAA